MILLVEIFIKAGDARSALYKVLIQATSRHYMSTIDVGLPLTFHLIKFSKDTGESAHFPSANVKVILPAPLHSHKRIVGWLMGNYAMSCDVLH